VRKRAFYGKAHSAAGTSRKSAFYNQFVTEKRILQPLLDRHVTEKRILQPLAAQ